MYFIGAALLLTCYISSKELTLGGPEGENKIHFSTFSPGQCQNGHESSY